MYNRILVLVVFIACFRFSLEEDNIRHAVLFDAGSSSTKGKAYSIDTSNGIPELSLLNHTKIKPGLGSFQDNLDGIEEHVLSLLRIAKTSIPEELYSSTPIYVMATAGKLCNKKHLFQAFFDADASDLKK